MVDGATRVPGAARVAPGAHEVRLLSGDPRWEVAAELGGAALEAFAAAVGGAPMEPELARVAAVALVRERSELTGWLPQGPITAGGSGRLLPAADGWLAVSLPRIDDLELLPAWLGLERPDPADDRVPWAEVGELLATRAAEDAAASAQELGLAVGVVADPARLREGDEQLRVRGTDDPARTHLRTEAGERVAGRSASDLRVVDLSSLWAGPTCARLLTRAGAEVVKVESTTRPDGGRLGNREFYERLHEGQRDVAVPFETDAGREELRRLLAEADVVIEGSRPRALDRLGIEPAEVVARRPGAVWVSITAYGRTGPWRDRVGFGDDCAAAGGLVAWTGDGRPEFVADAVADPLTGMLAAALVARAVQAGGGVVLDLALREVARTAATGTAPAW